MKSNIFCIRISAAPDPCFSVHSYREYCAYYCRNGKGYGVSRLHLAQKVIHDKLFKCSVAIIAIIRVVIFNYYNFQRTLMLR